jgi:hypothetical protein
MNDEQRDETCPNLPGDGCDGGSGPTGLELKDVMHLAFHECFERRHYPP